MYINQIKYSPEIQQKIIVLLQQTINIWPEIYTNFLYMFYDWDFYYDLKMSYLGHGKWEYSYTKANTKEMIESVSTIDNALIILDKFQDWNLDWSIVKEISSGGISRKEIYEVLRYALTCRLKGADLQSIVWILPIEILHYRLFNMYGVIFGYKDY